MKYFPIFLTLFVLTFFVFTPRTHALFGRIAAERQRRQETDARLIQQQRTTERLHIVVAGLSAGVVVALVVGAAVGSKTRREAPQS